MEISGYTHKLINNCIIFGYAPLSPSVAEAEGPGGGAADGQDGRAGDVTNRRRYGGDGNIYLNNKQLLFYSYFV